MSRSASAYVATRTTLSTGPNISIVVAAHAGFDVIQQRGAEEEAFGGRRVVGGHRRRPWRLRRRRVHDSAATRSRCSRGDRAAPSRWPAPKPGPTLMRGHALANRRDQRIGHVADGDHDGNRHAALAGRSVTRRRPRRRRPSRGRRRAAPACDSWRRPGPARACRSRVAVS